MSAVFAPVRPGPCFGSRPERHVRIESARLERRLQGLLAAGRRTPAAFRHAAPTLARIGAAAETLRATDELDRSRRRRALALRRRGQPLCEADALEIFAHVLVDCEALFDITLHDEQLYAGWAMLGGALVEMRTGEGKTLTAALPAIAVALGSTPVHVLTANDYLAARDAESLRTLYERFGLTVASVGAESPVPARAAAYGCDIVYGSARQFVFDYLRDASAGEDIDHGLGARLGTLLGARPPAPPLLRGLCFAIVDEADSVLVDEARTPLVLSEPATHDATLRPRVAVALAIARSLHADVDYRVMAERAVELSSSGHDAIDAQTARLSGVWRLPRYRHELVRQALVALHLFRPDRDYLVRDGRVELIDGESGRAQPDRKLRDGLHQMLEVKEGCEPSAANEVAASLSYQRFFARYHRLCGMSGTLAEARHELAMVYRLPVRRVPTHRPCRLQRWPTVIASGETAQVEALLSRVRSCLSAGRPILLGTRTLALAERLAAALTDAGIEHRRLDARHDAEEADVIARAGEAGAVTLATNMAGRGCDIPLAPSVREAGGLHVVELESNDSGRVVRQLFGRAARQGDPGSCESLLSLDDESLKRVLPGRIVAPLRRLLVSHPTPARWLALALFALVRRRIASRHAHERLALYHGTKHELRQLAVAGQRNV